MTRAIIFDCDGVLVNSEEIYRKIEFGCLAEIGLVFDPHDYADRFLGLTLEAYLAGLNDDHVSQFQRPLPDSFLDRMLALTAAELETSLLAHDGVYDAIVAVAGPKAVASSSSHDRLVKKLKHVGLFDIFGPHVYSAEAVKHGKPAPDLFLHTADKLEVCASTCIAVEDSVNGVKAAVGANMTVIGYVGGRHCTPRQAEKLRVAGAVKVIDHMNDLLQAMTEIG